MTHTQRSAESEQLAECASEARKQAALLPPGKVRDALLAKAQQYESRQSGSADGGESDQATLSSSTR
jgi:hypothetical protein